MDKFKHFADLVHKDTKRIFAERDVFEVNLDKDEFYKNYLAAFPEGTNPLYKSRTEHDCSCCRSFVRGVGLAVRVKGNSYETVWDTAVEKAHYPYNEVARVLRDQILASTISRLYRKSPAENRFGVQENRSMNTDGNVIIWTHFYSGPLPRHLVVSDMSEVARHETGMNTCIRSFEELSPDAVSTVLDLIQSNSIYRGQEFGEMVKAFKREQASYFNDSSPFAQRVRVAKLAMNIPALASFRSTVIGSLVQDLSSGVSVEDAVRMYESKVAPQNYKRTSAVVTPRMINAAMTTIRELDLEPALSRRLARLEDINVRDVLWVDGSAQSRMKGGLESMLLSAVKVPIKKSKTEGEVTSLDSFVENILPGCTSIEVKLENKHLNNLMVLTAPVNEQKQLFKWDNDFAWSYGGNVTDSIREKVKKAGGNVDNAALRISLAWFNHDDLDLHVKNGGEWIYFGSKLGYSSRGRLDVDMNVTNPVKDPVENVSWEHLYPGMYEVEVNNYNIRDRADIGFTLEVAYGTTTKVFSYPRGIAHRETIKCLSVDVKSNGQITVTPVNKNLVASERSSTRWGLNTETFVKVNAVTLSPNYWGDNKIGNKHTFFVLDGCTCDEEMRGIYNEFLNPRLEQHRKVFELIGEKTKCIPTPDHIAGVGFSSTLDSSVTVRVQHRDMGQRIFTITTKD